MSIERNIIFIFPISKTLKDLKDELNKNETGAVVYELDSISEYNQIIGIVEHSITFSSDLKKTEAYLKKCKNVLKKPTNKNILIQDQNVPARMFNKYQKAGLNEVILEGASAKSLVYKINMFFSPFEQAALKEEEAKNKAVMGNMTVAKPGQKKTGEREEYNSNERLRVEKTVDVEDDTGVLKKSNKSSAFALDAMLSSGAPVNLGLKKNKTDTSMLKSPFDKFQRKKLTEFNAVEAESKLKRATFQPIVGELKNNPHKKMDFKESGELARKKARDIELAEQEFKKKKINFEESLKELNKKNVQIELAESEFKKKKVGFEEVLKELERKKKATFEDTESGRKKKKAFDEFYQEMQRKKNEVDLVHEDLKKKKVDFREIDIEIGKKRKELEEEHIDLKKKRAILEELEGLKKKKGKILEEYAELEKKKKEFEEVLSRAQIKKLKFPDPEDLDKKKGKENKIEELKRKKGNVFEDIEFEKKKLKFEEVDLEKDNDPSKIKDANELKKKNSKFDEIEKEGKNYAEVNVIDNENVYKRAGFEEVGRERGFSLEENLSFQKEVKLDLGFAEKEKKEYTEQILDYGEFKKEKKQGRLLKEKEEEALKKQKELEKILDEPEYKFFENISFGLEFLIIYNDFLLKENITSLDLFKFIHFALLKSYGGDISFYLVRGGGDENETRRSWECLYSGHRVRKNLLLENDFDRYEAINIEEWMSQKIPFWRDETYQEEINEFIYPYFEEGELMGIAVSHFKQTVKDHGDASKVELLCMCLKGVIINEYRKEDKGV